MQTPPHLKQLQYVAEQAGIMIAAGGYHDPVTQTLLRRGCIEATPTNGHQIELQVTPLGEEVVKTGVMPQKAGTVSAWIPQDTDETPYIALFPRKEGDRVCKRTYYVQWDIDQSNNSLVMPSEHYDATFSPVDDPLMLWEYADLIRDFNV